MKLKENRAVKVCNFYVSNWHLLTILFPYLNTKLKEKAKIVTVLEENLENYAETLSEKIVLNNRDKEKILDINWEECNLEEDEEFYNYLDENIIKTKELIVIINGSTEFINRINEEINLMLNKKHIPARNVKLINCYNICNDEINMSSILDEHENVLNTLGETKVEEFIRTGTEN